MADFRKIFSDYGYQLFESKSVETAIIDAIKTGEIRYVLGIPLIIENAKIDYDSLLAQAKKDSILDKLLEILFISSKIIKDKEKIKIIRKILTNKKIKKKLDENEFREIYSQYSKQQRLGFPSQLHYYLSSLFAKKQIQILYKIKTGERLSKTDKEYYSRIIKKRVIAIRELAQFARDLIVRE